MPSSRPRLGPQGLASIASSAKSCAEIERARLRDKVEEASIRPSPGTSELLSKPLAVETIPSQVHRGRDVVLFDLMRMAPVHLIASRKYGNAIKRGVVVPAPSKGKIKWEI